MEYCLDAGDGTVSIWDGPAGVDLDGDGLFDDVMGDDDGDGLADHAVLDLDDDAVPESRFTDDGTGTWSVSDGSAPPPLRWLSLDGVEHTGLADVDADGVPERLVDTDRNGLADRAVSSESGTGYVDTDADGNWDVRLTDSDGDGTADAAGAL
jgi:hypothetical protein